MTAIGIELIELVIAIFVSTIVLWWVSKFQKLKKSDIKTALIVVSIGSLIFYIFHKIPNIPYFVFLTLDITGILLYMLLIKKFYELSFKKAFKVLLWYIGVLTIIVIILLILAVIVATIQSLVL